MSSARGRFTKNDDSISFSIIMAVIGSSFGASINMGYFGSVLNEPTPYIMRFMKTSVKDHYGHYLTKGQLSVLWSMCYFLYPIAAFCGGQVGARLVNRIGRKSTLLFNNITTTVAGLSMSISMDFNSVELFLIGRTLIGFSVGLITVASPMYLSEIAPTKHRGKISSIFYWASTIGLTSSNILGFDFILGSQTNWPCLFMFALITVVIQLICFSFCPESPKYLLVRRNRYEAAKKALEELFPGRNISLDLENLVRERNKEGENKKQISLRYVCMNRQFRKPLAIVIVVTLAQRMTGTNVINFYSALILGNAGFPRSMVLGVTTMAGVSRVIAGFLGSVFIDRAGRKTLLMCGLTFMFISSISLAMFLQVHHAWANYVASVSIFVFVASYSFGVAPVAWILVSELFTSSVRPVAASIGSLFNWSSVAFVGLMFPIMENLMGPDVWLIFTTITFFCAAFILIVVPETKGKTILEIQRILNPVGYREMDTEMIEKI